MYSTVPKALYYMGYVIQPSWEGGVYVHSREDTSLPKVRWFDCGDCAQEWIDKEVFG